MSGPDLCLLPFELPDPDNESGHVVRCRSRTWGTGNTSRAMVGGLAGEILSPVFTRRKRPTQIDLDL